MSIKCFIGNESVRGHARQQHIGPLKIMCLTRRQMKARGIPQRITPGMDFRGQSPL